MFVILEIAGEAATVLETTQDVVSLMQQMGATRAYIGDAYDPATINHNHLQSMREYARWAVIRPTQTGYTLVRILLTPVVDPVMGEVVCLKLSGQTVYEDGEYITTEF